jgi:hypothetical protein
MNHDELHELETTRRKALWVLANLFPGDPKATDALAILDNLEDRERNAMLPTKKAIELIEVRDLVPVERHHSGIDIVRELNIPGPWRERFLQASIGSTRLTDGSYARDWDKFLAGWEVEMRHLQQHRAARHKSGTD